jgi:hypothetical protein
VSYKFEPPCIVRVKKITPGQRYPQVPDLKRGLEGRIGLVIAKTKVYPSHQNSVVLVGREKVILHDCYLEKIDNI